jgi:PAS domain S-box-containing protein
VVPKDEARSGRGPGRLLDFAPESGRSRQDAAAVPVRGTARLVPLTIRFAWPAPAELRSAVRPALWLAVGLLASSLYLFGAALVPAQFSRSLPAPLYPPAAIILAVLLLTPPRHWWLLLLESYVILVAMFQWLGYPLWFNVIAIVPSMVEPLLGALLVRHFIPLPPRFDRVREFGLYTACLTAASMVGATLGAAIRALAGHPYWPSWQAWFLSDVLANLLLAPTIVLWVGAVSHGLQAPARWRAVEATLLGATLVLVGGFAFGTHVENPDVAPALLYLPVPLLLWAAVRFGPHGIAAALTLVTVFAIAGVASGLGPFLTQSTQANVLTLQLFLLVIGVPLFFLAALERERQQAEEGMERSEERYRAVVSNFPHGAVLLFGPDLRHLFADGQGLPEVGLSRESIEGKTVWEAFPDDMASALAPRYQAALTGADSAFELTHAGRTYQTQVLPVRYADMATGMVVMQDVTEERRAEVLAELDRTKTAFFNNVSHEFRTPLTLLLAPLQELLAAPPDGQAPQEREQLDTAYRNGLRLLKLVNTLLDFSRLEAGRLQAVYAPTDLATYTAELASLFRSAIEHAGLRLEVDCPPLPEPVYVDRDQWEQIVLNLLSNAFKFTFTGEIAVSLRAERERVVLAVRDTGTGIPPEEMPHLFERFHRVQGAPARTQEGTGIGLALVQELVRVHGGMVDVRTAVGEGSTFTVAVPRGMAHLPADRIGAPADANRASSAAAYLEEVRSWLADDRRTLVSDGAGGVPPPATGSSPDAEGGTAVSRPARVLVADDNADMRAYVVRLLRGRGNVEAVGDGATALEVARTWEPDLILADVMMPGLDGFALLQAVRADPRLRSTSVVLLSARAGAQDRTEGLLAGADDYLVKPFAAAELLARVDGQLGLVRLRGEARFGEDVGRALTSADPLPARLQYCAEAIVRHLDIASAQIWTVDESGQDLGLQASAGISTPLDGPLGQEVRAILKLELIAERRKPHVINRAVGAPRLGDAERAEHDDLLTFAGYPLFIEERVFGVLTTFARHSLSEGTLGALAAVVDSITLAIGRAHAEAALRKSEDRFRIIVSTSSDAIWDWDLRTDYVWWNEGVSTLFGHPREAVRPDADWWIEHIHPDDRQRVVDGIHAVIDGDEFEWQDEYCFLRADGTTAVVFDRGNVIRDAQGAPVRMVGGMMDVTARRRAEQERERLLAAQREANEQLERLNKAKSDFVSVVSHEFRTPLTGIQAFSELIRDEAFPVEQVKEFAADINREAERLNRMIGEMLDLDRMESGRMTLHQDWLDLNALAAEAVEDTRPTAPRHALGLVLDPALPPVWGDRDKLLEVVLNLLSNAIKYSPESGEVTVGTRLVGSTAHLWVEDQGVGIPPEALEVIFERYTRVESGPQRFIQGTGLGLPIVRQIAELHGGRAWAESDVGCGSTFHVTLPLTGATKAA